MLDATPRTLDAWLVQIERVHPRGIDMGLARVAEVAERMQLRRPAPLCFVVGGTNGKGSTTTAIEQILLADGLHVGATFSPHLLRFNERVRVDGREVEDATLCAAFAAIDIARAQITLTYFEFGMLAAFWCFRQANVDAAVIEVGLGGRFDAANIVDADVSVITTVGLDHMDYLGPDRDAIGFDKAHIARHTRPLIVGEPDPPQPLLDVAHTIGAHVVRRGTGNDAFALTPRERGFDFRLQLDGGAPTTRSVEVDTALILDNVGSALAALAAADRLPSAAVIARGLRRASVPGRLQHIAREVPIYVDVAHNPHGAAFLCGQLASASRTVRGRTHAVLATYADKDADGIIAALCSQAHCWWLADTEGARAGTAARLLDALRRQADPDAAASLYPDAVTALAAARAAAVAGDRIVVCGSFQAAAAVLTALGETPLSVMQPDVQG